MQSGGGVGPRSIVRALAAVAGCAVVAGCATIPSGSAAVVTNTNGRMEAIGEGEYAVSPLAHVDVYDMRAQERDEDLVAITADGVPVEARTSVVTYQVAPDELVALERDTGPAYYEVAVKPIVRASVRRVIAAYRADQLDAEAIADAGRRITELAATRLRPFHIILDAIDLRTLALVMSEKSYRTVLDVGVLEQQLQAEPQRLEVARQRAEALRQRARAIAAAHAHVAPTLTPAVLADDAIRARAALLAAPRTRVIVDNGRHPTMLEVQ